jgi:hypothetical protein
MLKDTHKRQPGHFGVQVGHFGVQVQFNIGDLHVQTSFNVIDLPVKILDLLVGFFLDTIHMPDQTAFKPWRKIVKMRETAVRPKKNWKRS